VIGSKPGVGSVAKTTLANAKMAAEKKDECIVKAKEGRTIQRAWCIKDTKVRETKCSGEGKVKARGIPEMGHSQIYTKITSSPKRHMLASSQIPSFDRHKVVVLQATGRRSW
jgi:hypothetical protein